MGKPQTFDIFAVSIPDSNVQMAVARIMVGADRYLSMQAALDQVKSPPVLLFKNTDLRDAEQHIAKLKALGVGFRVVRADGSEDDSIMRDEDLPGAPPAHTAGNDGKEKPAAEAALSDILNSGGAWGAMPPIVSVQDAISRHRHHGANAGADDHKGAGGRTDTDGFSGFGSASGGHYGGGGGAGIRAGAGLLGDLKNSEAASNKKKRLVSVVAAAIVVAIALLFVLAYKDRKFDIQKIPIPAVAGGIKQKAKQPKGGGDTERDGAAAAAPDRQFGNPVPDRQFGGSKSKQRNSVNNQQRRQANSYVDSAKTNDATPDKRVAFYTIAISFNRYNLQAWHGLLQTYREMNDAANARATEAQMQEIFGKEVNSVNAAVTQFGELIDAYTSEGGVYRVEYKTKKTSEDDIKREVLNLTRAVRNACKCRDISVYASTGNGGGLTAHSTAETSVHTLQMFSQQAEMSWSD